MCEKPYEKDTNPLKMGAHAPPTRIYVFMIKKITFALIFTLCAAAFYFKDFLASQFTNVWGLKSTFSPQSAPTILVVDIGRVRDESVPFKQLSQFIEKRYSESNKQIFNLEGELRQEYKNLRSDEKLATADHDALVTRREDFDRRVSEIEQTVMRKKSDLNAVYLTEKNKIERLLNQIIADLAQSENASIVFNTSLGDEAPLVLFQKNALDKTDAVIASLNAGATHLDLLTD